MLVIEHRKVLSQFYCSALVITKALREKPDLVTLDLTLPGIFGSEVANALGNIRVLPKTLLNSNGSEYTGGQAGTFAQSRCFDSQALPPKHSAGSIRRASEFHNLESVLYSGFSFGG